MVLSVNGGLVPYLILSFLTRLHLWELSFLPVPLFGENRLNVCASPQQRTGRKKEQEESREIPGDTSDADPGSLVRGGADFIAWRLRIIPRKEHWPICLSKELTER